MDTESTLAKTAAEEAAAAERTRCGACYRPNVDIMEENNELLVVADVPGARGDSIDVKFENGTLEPFRPLARDRTRDRTTCCGNTASATITGPSRSAKLLTPKNLGRLRRRRPDAPPAEGRGREAQEDRRQHEVRNELQGNAAKILAGSVTLSEESLVECQALAGFFAALRMTGVARKTCRTLHCQDRRIKQ